MLFDTFCHSINVIIFIKKLKAKISRVHVYYTGWSRYEKSTRKTWQPTKIVGSRLPKYF